MSEQEGSDKTYSSLECAVLHLRKGGVVAFPTETYYGLAVDPYCEAAVARLFKIKQRQTSKPLLLLIEKIDQLSSVAEEIPEEYVPLIEKYWPGPLTLVFQAKKGVSGLLTGNSGTIGVRISPHQLAQALVKKMGKPITATSANISGFPPAKSAQEVVEIFGDKVDYVVDGGATMSGLCSTILGLQDGRLTLIRPGQIDLSDEFDD
jgi:L-threonylcarbamoyladenylate synthase